MRLITWNIQWGKGCDGVVDLGRIVATARAFGDGHTRFEPESPEHHDHLVCTKCSQVVEFRENEIERLQDEVARNAGFEISSHNLELYGACKQCRTSGAH